MGGDIRTRGPGLGVIPPPVEDNGALGSGVVQLTEFALYKHASGAGHGALLINGTDVTVTAYGFTARAIADLFPATSDTGILTHISSINHGQLCLDSNSDAFCSTDSRTDANDVFGVFSSATPSPDDPAGPAFSYADQQCNGAIVSNIGFATPMQMQAGAATQTHSNITQSTGDSQAYNTLAMTFVLTLEASAAIDIVFSAAYYNEAWASGDTSVLASATTEIKVRDDTTSTVVFDWFPDGTTGALSPGGTSVTCPFLLNASSTFASPNAGTTFNGSALGSKYASAAFKGETPVLVTGHTFTITINCTVNNQLPPPE